MKKKTYIIIILLIIISIFLWINIKNNNNDVIEQSKKEVELVKKSLSKHMILPADDQMDIRKITNKVDDVFFKDAEIGDYLIMFYKNRIAYIYSLDKNIIINAGVIFIDPKTATTTKK